MAHYTANDLSNSRTRPVVVAMMPAKLLAKICLRMALNKSIDSKISLAKIIADLLTSGSQKWKSLYHACAGTSSHDRPYSFQSSIISWQHISTTDNTLILLNNSTTVIFIPAISLSHLLVISKQSAIDHRYSL